MGWRVVTPPASEPVSLVEAKLHLKVDVADDDALIATLIAAAREQCEKFSGRSFVSQVLELTLDEFPCSGIIELPRPPLITLTSIKYIDSAGVEQTIDPADYQVDTSSDTAPARVMPAYAKSWPTTRCQANAVTVRYTAGYAAFPNGLKLAILFAVASWYEQRQTGPLPEGSERLLWQDRIVTFA